MDFVRFWPSTYAASDHLQLCSSDLDKENLIQSESDLPKRYIYVPYQKAWIALSFINILILCFATLFFFNYTSRRTDDLFCATQLSTYSPAIASVKYFEYQWPNGFDQQDPYRGVPTAERDAAWMELWSLGDIVVREDELSKLNKSNEAIKRLIRPELGGIAANLEVFHQLHCLDMIRRYTYLDSYPKENLPNDFKDVDPGYLRDHVDHCITTIRLALMCTSDLTPILLERDVENIISVIPDLQTKHKCRDFGKVREWFLDHSYTDYECIKKGAVGCDIIPLMYKRPLE